MNEWLYRCTCDKGDKIEKKKDNVKSTSQYIMSFRDESDAIISQFNIQIVINSFLIVFLFRPYLILQWADKIV